MSKIDLLSKDWCNLVFAGKNQEYGAYRIRANAGRRQLRAVVIVIVLIVALVLVPLAISWINDSIKSSNRSAEFKDEMEMANLKKDKPKKPKEEEKKDEIIHEIKKEAGNKVAVKASIQFTAPVIKADNQIDRNAELKSQDELNSKPKFSIGSANYKGDAGAQTNIDDLLKGQETGGTGKGSGTGSGEGSAGGNGIATTVEQPPTFPGGEAALLRYISTHLKYPQAALENEIQGTISLRFVVEKNGSVGDVQVVKSFGDRSCEKEAIRVVKSLPRFIPGKMQGKAVRVWYTVPIRFMIQ